MSAAETREIVDVDDPADASQTVRAARKIKRDKRALDDAGAPVRADGGHLEVAGLKAELVGHLISEREAEIGSQMNAAETRAIVEEDDPADASQTVRAVRKIRGRFIKHDINFLGYPGRWWSPRSRWTQGRACRPPDWHEWWHPRPRWW